MLEQFNGTFMCKNSVSYTQSAGNQATQRSLMSSSETTRETSFNLTAFNNHRINQPPLSSNWLFIGFAEGDGAILTSKSRPRFQKESAVLYMIQGNYYRFTNITSLSI